MIVKDEFYPYYELALRLVGIKYLDKTTNVREGISQRWQRVYFKDLKEQEDADKIFESNLKKEEIKQASPEDAARLNALMDQLSSLRSSSDQAIISKSNDSKS
jgi:hypothetical protein